MWWALAVATALAGPVRIPYLAGGTAEVLPQATSGRVDVLFRPVPPKLTQMYLKPSKDVRAIRVTDFGGSAVVTLWTWDTEVEAAVVAKRRRWEIWVWSEELPPSGRQAPVPTGWNEGDLGCDDPPGSPLIPLHGSDALVWLPQHLMMPDVPRWVAAEPEEVSWDRVSEVRLELREISLRSDTSPLERARLAYELGALHRDLDFDREAAYYFERAQEDGAPGGLGALNRAAALLRLGDWEEAEESAVEASRLGAHIEWTLTVQAVADVFMGTEPRAAVGLSLSSLAPAPTGALAAGAALLRSGCFSSAIAPLEIAVTSEEPGRRSLAQLLLAEALLLSGDSEEADGVLGDFKPVAGGVELTRVFSSRSMLMSMVQATPTQWPGFFPELHRLAGGKDVRAADALFLLGQLGGYLNEPRLSLESYGKLVDRWRPLAEGEPGERLLDAWAERINWLVDGGDDLAAAADHTRYWRPSILPLLQDPEPLNKVAGSYARLGLHRPALGALTDVGRLQMDIGQDDRYTILAIAESYAALGGYEEVADTLAFLDRRPPSIDTWARQQLLRGKMLERAGDPVAAREVYSPIRGPQEVVDEAGWRIGLIDANAGNCEMALVLLPSDPPEDGPISRGVILAARARCLAVQGQPDEARAEARRAAEALQDPSSADAFRYMSRAGLPDEDGGVWERLGRADAAWADLKYRHENRQEKKLLK